MVFEIGRVCVKLAGRDAGKKCVVIKKIDESFYLVDGQTRRRKVNKNHLEPIKKTVEIKEDATNAQVAQALTSAGIECAPRKEKEVKQKAPRPKKQKVVKSQNKDKTKKSATKKQPKKTQDTIKKEPTKKQGEEQ